MSLDLRFPNITGSTPEAQLAQMRSFLHQTIEQINWAFKTLESGNGTSASSGARAGGKAEEGKSPADTFSDIKSLIIKSADIVNAYYEKINARLVGEYVAQSDFGSYSEKTAMDIQANSTSINQLFEDNRELSTTVEELYNQSVGTNAYIKTGLLGEHPDGTPVYGLEIGQTNSINGENVFDKFARFTSDRLSFFDRNDVEVAYISDYKLYITNAEITGSLQLSGRFKIYFNNGLAFQWIGGG